MSYAIATVGFGTYIHIQEDNELFELLEKFEESDPRFAEEIGLIRLYTDGPTGYDAFWFGDSILEFDETDNIPMEEFLKSLPSTEEMENIKKTYQESLMRLPNELRERLSFPKYQIYWSAS